MHHLVVCSNIQIMLEQGNAAEADSYLSREWKACRKRGLNAFPLVRVAFCSMAADVLCASDHVGSGTRVRQLTRLADRIEKEPLGISPGIAASIRASAAALQGNRERASNYSKQARIHLEAAGLCLAALAETVDWDAASEDAHAMQLRGVRDPSSWRRRRRCFL
jgi:hypothetical protein